MIKHFKMCKIECDGCRDSFFEVFTYEEFADAPEGWKDVSYYSWFSERTCKELFCKDCVDNIVRTKKNDIISIDIPEIKLST